MKSPEIRGKFIAYATRLKYARIHIVDSLQAEISYVCAVTFFINDEIFLFYLKSEK